MSDPIPEIDSPTVADKLGGCAPLILGGIAALVAAAIGYLASVEYAAADRSAPSVADMHRATR